MEIKSQLIPVQCLMSKERGEMFALLADCYLGVREDEFIRDLEAKDEVIVLRDIASGAMVGFSTLVCYHLGVAGVETAFIFSGDTVVKSAYRNSSGLGQGLLSFFSRILLEGKPTYYILISKGWRTYRALPLLFHDFYPRHDVLTPECILAVKHVFGETFYPGQYDASLGIIKAQADGQRIKPDSAESLPKHCISDPHILFFAEANPQHEQGDELVCVIPIQTQNFSRAFMKMRPK